jgi:polysaccharide biosynthesis protein PslH
MKILFLTTHFPSPPNYGAAKRVYHLCHLLKKMGEVTLVVLRLSGSDDQDRFAQTRKDFSAVKVFYSHQAPPKGLKGKIERMFSLTKVGSRHFSLSEQTRSELNELVDRNDIVWCHTLLAADMGGIFDYGRSIIDLDDLNSDKLNLQARERKRVVNWKAYWQSLLWRRWEKNSLRRFCAATVCSENDRRKMGSRDNVFVLPNGFETPTRPIIFKKRRDNVIGFVGILNYPPNLNGVRWFVREVLPILQQSEPTVRLRVAGRLPTEGLGVEHAQMDILGFVEDLDSEMLNWDAMVVPLKVAGGTRLKILEAFCKKMPVISTHLGAYGIEAEHGRHLLLADEPKMFAKQCLKVIRNRDAAEELTYNAYQLFHANYTWDKGVDKIKDILDFIQSCAK